jgi:signal transduction histidine kinase
LDKVFERGYRALNASRHRSDGSGLGLSIARALAEGHGGGVALASDPAAGTHATVTLPLIRTPDGDAT